MRERLHVGLSQKTGQGFAIGGHARGVGFRHNFELGIGEEDGADMLRLAELIEDGSHHIELTGVGLDCFDAGARLQGIGGVDDGDPVAVAEEREFFVETGAPVGGCGVGAIADGRENAEQENGSEDQDCSESGH